MIVLQSFLKSGQWLYTAVSRTRPSSPTPQQQKSHPEALRKLEQAEQVRTLLHTLREEGREPIWTDGLSDRPQVGGSWVGGYGAYFPSRPGVNVSEFVPVGEPQTIGRAELRAVLRALNEVTMLQPAAILCDSKYIVDGCKGQAQKWQRNDWRTTAGLVKHTDL